MTTALAPACRRSLGHPVTVALGFLVMCGLLGKPAATLGQDFQLIAVGNGFPNSECVLAGKNGSLNSVPGGDDFVSGVTRIVSGSNGRCETALGGDDTRPAGGIDLGRGEPNREVILAGTPGSSNGICSDAIAARGDDVVRVSAGHSEPRMIAIGAGTNGTLESSAAGDDQSTGVICPGTDGQIQSVVDPADSLSLVSPLCDLCPASACVVPGADGQLQSTVSASDVKKPFISTGPDGVSQSTATGDDLQVIAPGKGFDETVCVDAGPDGIAQTSLCGNGITDDEENRFANDEECDDGNTVAGDQCSSICQVEVCGNGIVQGLTEECDDGDIDNSDECAVGCKNARCGDGFLHKGVEECEPPNTTTCDPLCQAIKPPRCGDKVPQAPEACDDGNKSNQDDCLTTCQLAACGDLFVHSKGTPPFEECDDGNTAAGDGCDAGCKKECGNGVIDGACAEGRVGAPCTADSGCDTVPGNGVCHLEQCDPGAAGLCGSTPPACSNVCRFLQCGNGEVECDEECDQGSQNGVPGSPCSGACKLTVVGGSEVDGRTECLAAWTLEQAPGDLKRPKQKCRDGDPCDFDTARNGACTLRVGVCLNRQGVGGCTPGGLKTFELQKLDVTVEEQAAVAENIATAVKNLASQGQADAPDRCSAGLVGKVCSIPDNQECDSAFGAGDGICDVGASVLFAPLLQPVDSGQSGSQLTPCTPPVDVVVQQNARLKLRMVVRREDGKGDKDQLVLACVP